MDLPSTLHHYYERERGPYLSMSELSDEAFSELMDELGQVATVENRFDEDWKRDFYRPFRRYVERTLRDRFVAKGGRPRDAWPRYFSLGPVTWFQNWYLDTAEEVVPLSAVPPEQISFTLPDSMMSFLIAEDRFEPFARFKQPHHGEVFTLDEIRTLIAEIGLPDETDADNMEYGNRIVEAQVWDYSLLERLRRDGITTDA